MKTIVSLFSILGLWLAPQVNAPKVESPLARVAVIGASVSAGYGIGQTLIDGEVKLADVVQASITVEHSAPRNLASSLAFLNFPAYMQTTSAALAKDPPTAVIAVDYLFWAVHGTKPDAQRAQELNAALAGLEKLSCPILLGDLPDVTRATTGASPMIAPNMMPSPEVRAAANARIRDWAKQHSNVTVIPIADLMKTVYADHGLRVRNWSWPETLGLIQPDMLHPNIDGLVAIWIFTADSWLAADSTLPESSFDLQVTSLNAAARLKLRH